MNMAQLLDAKHVRRRKAIKLKAILVNEAENGELYWHDISEDNDNFYLEGYETEIDGVVSESLTLSKEKWAVKDLFKDSVEDWKEGESKRERKARRKAEREAREKAEKAAESACDVRSQGKITNKTVLDWKYGELDD
jgi:hypothetical protein